VREPSSRSQYDERSSRDLGRLAPHAAKDSEDFPSSLLVAVRGVISRAAMTFIFVYSRSDSVEPAD